MHGSRSQQGMTGGARAHLSHLSSSLHGPHSPAKNNTYHAGQTIREMEADSYARLFVLNQCYEAMPTSSKMVVFDTSLLLEKAFHGLIYQNTRHVLLSDAEQGGAIVGLLSVTDFIRVMLQLYRKRKASGASVDSTISHKVFASDTEDLGKMTIADYRDLIQSEGKLMDLITINANCSLLDCARLLARHHIHRLPVLDPDSGSPLFILTHKRLLKFLFCFGKQYSLPEYHVKTAKQLGVGTWSGIRVVFPDTPLHDCLDILLNKGVSGLPVVERDSYKVIDMYSRFDAVGIALEERENSLDVTVEQALAFKNTFKREDQRVVSVRDTDTFWKAVEVLVDRNVHRLCAVNDKGAIEGVISLSDVINFMVVRPGKELVAPKVTRRYHTHSMGGDLNDADIRSLLSDSAAFLEETAHGKMTAEMSQLNTR